MDALAKLFGGPARLKLLRLFLFNHTQQFDVEDLSNRTKVAKSTVRKELNLFENIGLIRRRSGRKEVTVKSGKRTLVRRKATTVFGTDETFAYFTQLRAFLLETAPLDGAGIISRLRTVGPLQLAVVSGAFMREWDHRLDILIVCKKVNTVKLERAIKDIEAELGLELRYAAFATDDFLYRMDMYDKLVRDVFDYPHQIIVDRLGITSPERVFV